MAKRAQPVPLMNDDDRVQPDSVQEWREWLAAHHTRRTGVWLVTWRAGSGGPQIGYDESVEQALCFGWVDSKGAHARRPADDAVVRTPQGAQRMGPVEQASGSNGSPPPA